MAKLHKELGQYQIRTGLCGAMGTAQSLSRGRMCSWAHSLSLARSPLVESSRKEIAKWPRGDSLIRSSCPCSRHSSTRASHQGDNNNQARHLPRLQWGDPQACLAIPKPTVPTPHGQVIAQLLEQASSPAPTAGIQEAHCQMPPFTARFSSRVFAPGSHKEASLVWPWWWPGQHTTITCWLGQLFRRCHR